MPPKAQKESLVLVINIGVTRPNAESNPSLVEKAKLIAKRKIEKMIFLKPKDEVAVLLMGSPVTKNSINSQYVEEFADFEIPNWDLIEKLMALESTKYCSNWVEALAAAEEFIKQNVGENTIKKMILMSDFNEEADIISQFEANTLAESLSSERIDLITIGEEVLNGNRATSLKVSEVLLKDVLTKMNGQHITFDDAISSLKFYIQTPSNPCPCYYNLELLDKKIPVARYVKIDEPKFRAWETAENCKKLQTKTIYIDRQGNTYKQDEIIQGYKYGGIFTPVEKDLEQMMSYKSGEKSYRIYGFTNRNNMDLDYFYKSPSHVILPSCNVDSVTEPFYSLVQALHNTNSIAIVRRVYKKDDAPRMVALFPCIDVPDEPWCLVEIELAFAEDRRVMEIRPMKSILKQLSSEQNEAVDNLIDSLMLPDTEDTCEVDGSKYFLPGCVPNPVVQHRWHVLSYRALNPDKPLPPMEDYLKEILEAPTIKERSKYHLQKIAQLFRLESIDPKSKQKGDEREEIEDSKQIINTTAIKESDKTEDNVDAEDSIKDEPALPMDTSDVDLDELAANI